MRCTNTHMFLQELTGSKNIKLKPQIDESLIAGFIVKYGSSEIDLSVKGQLNKISNELVRVCTSAFVLLGSIDVRSREWRAVQYSPSLMQLCRWSRLPRHKEGYTTGITLSNDVSVGMLQLAAASSCTCSQMHRSQNIAAAEVFLQHRTRRAVYLRSTRPQRVAADCHWQLQRAADAQVLFNS